ncbi:unnamed protein product, partial [Mesorhabditis belari]|uniref:Conserved oligomeric Golgi complex subunit 2 n=1 Tax=Mesorhabditis belari TaxID=2138241 RepID=A0AAF3FE38_9BILA
MTELDLPKSPTTSKMFPSQLASDEIQLCFNKAHFAQNDFNVERFMNLARRRASLEEIHKDLRIYLKSIQNSMIELINDDYADFVHLSSNLVALKESISKIEADLESIWEEFQTTTKPFVEIAEHVELKSKELSRNRSEQTRIRDEITFLRAIESMAHSLARVPSPINMIWLEQFCSSVVDVTTFKGELTNDSKEKTAFNKVIARSHAVLADQAICSLKGDCQLLPMILSVLNICECTDQLVAKIVSVVLAPKVIAVKGKPLEMLNNALKVTKEIRFEWSAKLGEAWNGHVESFLDQTLLTFLITYLDEHLATVLCPTVVSDARHFHSCFTSVGDFITSWPTATKQMILLKQLKGKFQMPLYFKITTNAFSKSVNEAIDPANFKLLSAEEKEAFQEEGEINCNASAIILDAIKSIWADDIFLLSLTDKFWEFTLRVFSKHQAWARAMIETISTIKESDYNRQPKWMMLLLIRQDLSQMDQSVFNVALEMIWPKLKELGVDPGPFGQCLSKESQAIKTNCDQINTMVETVIIDLLKKEIDGVSDIPRQYRWTKKAAPTKHSHYVDSCRKIVEDLGAATNNEPEFSSSFNSILSNACEYFVEKANQVMQTVAVTGSSISRYKRREGSHSQPEGDSDESKIRSQIVFDAEELNALALEKDAQVSKMDELIESLRTPTKESS